MFKPVLAALAVSSVISGAAHAALPAYRSTVLQALQEADGIAAYSINDAGTVVGFSADPEPWGQIGRAHV